LVETGDTVAAGDPVVVIEAMKSEQKVDSSADGTVAEFNVEEVDEITPQDVLLTLK
jgi:biotin carboxyl carrier protein